MEGIKELTAECDKSQVAGISFGGQMHGLVALDKDDNVITLQEVLENNERSIEDAIDLKLKEKKLYEKMASILKPREREILILRFGLNNSKPLTQNEVANIFGISRSYVSRIETKAISKLAKEIKE